MLQITILWCSGIHLFEKLSYTCLRPKLCYRLVKKYKIINLHTCDHAQFKHFLNFTSGKIATFQIDLPLIIKDLNQN